MADEAKYHLGCPAWSIPEWRGNFLPQGTAQNEFLKLYSGVFNTVEGNSFFYALPKLDVVKRWATESDEGFQFCMKVPRDISHSGRLGHDPGLCDALVERLEILQNAGRLGPTFLQLHSSFEPSRLPELQVFLENWSPSIPLAVEVRHPDFFNNGVAEEDLNELLASFSVDRVIFDSRALFQAPPSDPVEARSQSRKPRLPVSWVATGKRPFIRFVGRNTVEDVDPWQDEVVAVVAGWIEMGKRPYVFMHTPDDTFAPQLCRRFHQKLQKLLPCLSDLEFPKITVQITSVQLRTV